MKRRWIALTALLLLAGMALGGYVYARNRTGSIYHPHARFVPQANPVLPKRGPERFSWPLYGYTANHARYYPAPASLRPPFRKVWAVGGGSLREFPPVLSENRIFQLTDNGILTAVDKWDGQILWSRGLGALSASTPAVPPARPPPHDAPGQRRSSRSSSPSATPSRQRQPHGRRPRRCLSDRALACSFRLAGQDRRVADRHPEPSHQPLRGPPARAMAKQPDDSRQAGGPGARTAPQTRHALGEDAPLAQLVATPPAPQASIHNDRRSLSGQIPERSPVSAVARFGLCAASRAGGSAAGCPP